MNSKELYFRLLKYLKPYLKVFIISIVTIIIYALMEPLLPALMKPLLDGSFVNNTNNRENWEIPLMISAIFLARGILFFISKYTMSIASQSIVKDLRAELFNKIAHLPTTFFNNTPTGQLISKITFDISRLSTTTTEALIIMVRDSITILVLIAFLIYTSWQLSLFVIVLAPFIAIIIKIVSNKLRKISRDTQENMGDITHTLEETINGHKITKIFSGHEYEQNRFNKINNSLKKTIIKSTVISAASISIVQMFNATAVSMVVYFALIQSQNNNLSVGSFMSFLMALSLLWPSVKRLTKVNESLQQGLAAAESIFGFADQHIEHDPHTQKIDINHGLIEFEKVAFSYKKGEQILNQISFTIEPKKVIALIGESGSGKSTLVQLIPNLYQLESGAIKIDGQNISDYSLKSLRHSIAYVDQNITLFNDTIYNNIAYGALKNASKDEIIAAATAAEAIGFIEKLPDGFNTKIGNNGALLSGGQRQRIAIARALLKPAPILILDEATSALDQLIEQKIQQSISKLKNKKTVIIITHRLAAITKVDKIYLFDQGNIIDSGSHDELILNSKKYQELFNANI